MCRSTVIRGITTQLQRIHNPLSPTYLKKAHLQREQPFTAAARFICIAITIVPGATRLGEDREFRKGQ